VLGATQTSPLSSLLLLPVLVVLVVLVRRGKLQSTQATLGRGERIRPLAITLLDPLVSLVIIGGYLWRLSTANVAHLVAAIAGAAVGVAIGRLRAKVMYVRAVPETRSIVLTRSGLEYALVGLLLVLRLTENSLNTTHATVASAAVAALAALALSEAFARSAFIVARYRREAAAPAPPPPPPPGWDSPPEPPTN